MTENEAIQALKLEGGIEITGNGKRVADFIAGLEIAISALKEIQQYREMDKKLREAYGDCDGLLAIAVEGLCKHSGINIGEPIKARLLIDEDVDKWDAYREIGTVEECWEAVEKQKPKKCDVTKDNFRIYYKCPTCNHCLRVEYNHGSWMGKKSKNCSKCGQAIQWEESEEE